MSQALHSQAHTTHLIREDIRTSRHTQATLARLYNVSRQTIRKWQNRETPVDGSHRPKTMYTTLTQEQELIVVELRKTLLLHTDDLLAVTREFINPSVSRAGLGRCLRRHGVSDLRNLAIEETGAPAPKETFKDYESGFLHIDIEYLPQMPDETARRYLFAAIDRATRWVYIEIYADQSESSSVNFMSKVKAACSVKIDTILTDNGSQSTDRFTSKSKEKRGKAAYWDALVRPDMQASPRSATPSANQWHGRTLQWPHQRHHQPDPLWLRRRARNNLAQLCQDLQPQHPTARIKTSNVDSRPQRMTRKAAESVR